MNKKDLRKMQFALSKLESERHMNILRKFCKHMDSCIKDYSGTQITFQDSNASHIIELRSRES